MTSYDKEKVLAIQNIIDSHKKNFQLCLKSNKNRYLYQYVIESTSQFVDLPFNTRLYWILNDIHDYPKCKICGLNDIRHNTDCHPTSGYSNEYCSISCSLKDPEKQELKRQKCLEKYGVDCVQKSQKYKDALKSVLAQRSDEDRRKILEKRRKTCLEKYGVDSISKIESISEHKSIAMKTKTIEEKEDIQKRTTETCLRRYGVNRYSNSEKISQTKQAFTQEKKDCIRQKTIDTCLEKYGVENIMQYEEISSRSSYSKKCNARKKFYTNVIADNDLVQPLFSCTYYVEHAESSLKWKCKKCGEIFEQKRYEHQPFIARCLHCYPLNTNISNLEEEVANYISTIYTGKMLRRCRTAIYPNELDIYCPDVKIAIEFDGIYWHSSNLGTPDDYHLKKTQKCEELGIQLIHIFENEWILKKDIVKSRLLNLLGTNQNRIFARKCEVKHVEYREANAFLDKNHIQGACRSSIRLGLYYERNLVALMTFGKCRFTRKYQYELLRFCTIAGCSIVGGASRLLKHFEEEYKPESLLSYADRRWSCGKIYEILGFKLDHYSKPDYWYYSRSNFNNLMHRSIFQKHKLSKILEKYDEKLTEYQNMSNNNYFRIFDCGNIVFVKKYLQ